MPDLQRSNMRHIRLMMLALPLTSARFNKLRILFLNHLLVGDLCKNYFDFHILSFFLVLDHDFVIYIDFTHVAALDTANGDVTN